MVFGRMMSILLLSSLTWHGSISLGQEAAPDASKEIAEQIKNRDLTKALAEIKELAKTATTVGGAMALRRPDLGRIKPGYLANLAILTAPSYLHLSYRPGVSLVGQTWSAGRRIFSTTN